jgi:uncharacterized damage-inducible protein DinB
MHAEVQKYWDQYEHVHNEIFKWAEGLTDEQLNWRPPGNATNTIGNLMSHILGGQQFGVVERVGGVSLNRDRSAEFINPVTRDWLVQRRAEVAGRIRETLEQLTPADLSRTIKVGNGETIVERWLLNIVSHFSGHLGQVILTRKLLDAQR